MLIDVSVEMDQKRSTFFRLVYGTYEGYICIAHISRDSGRGTKKYSETFFHWPDQEDKVLQHCNKVLPYSDVYFCPQLFDQPVRKKENVIAAHCAWADLDSCDPRLLLVKPSVTVESSPGRFQAYWCFTSDVEPSEAEDISRRIAYHHADDGADRSGWDLTQLLRVPYTYNMKQTSDLELAPDVKVLDVGRALYRLSDFTGYDTPAGFEYGNIDLPPEDSSNWPRDDVGAILTSEAVLQKVRLKINPMVWTLYQSEPAKDWSAALWQLEMLLFEAGLSREEAYLVTSGAACNKYARDNKSAGLLWKEICRAEAVHLNNINHVFKPNYTDEDLVTDEERAWVEANPSFVERYIEWARSLGDAAPQYHQAGALVALSSVLSGSIRLPTSFGTIIPNLWFMILADTTLTRKSTAMDIAMDLVMELDPEAVLATDGSVEGLMTSLSMRPGRPSIFLRDEFSGLLEQMTKKDYMAGMPETFTKLYDGKYQKRILRKESIEVRDPVLILFAGGIKNKITSLLTFEQVSSGFMPRFIFITAESDVTKLKPIGPPTERSLGNRQAIKDELLDMYVHYNQGPKTITLAGAPTMMPPTHIVAELTDDAWVRYNQTEATMMKAGLESERPDLMTPTYDRLCKSALKCAVLMAAARQRTATRIDVDIGDLVRAFYYMEGWRAYVRDVIDNVGTSSGERQIMNVLRAVERRGSVTRSVLMQNHHLTARDADAIFATLEQRGLVRRQRIGKAETLYAIRTGAEV